MKKAASATSSLALLPFGYYATRRRDNRLVSRVLTLMGLDTKSALDLELKTVLRGRVSDCRDLFALRGVRPPSATVLRLAARRIRAEPDASWRSETLGPARAAALLGAAAALMERVGKLGYAACVREAALKHGATVAPVAPSSLPQAAHHPIEPDQAVVALRAIHKDSAPGHALPPGRRERCIAANASFDPEDEWREGSVRLAA